MAVIELDSIRDRRLDELTRRALQLPRYRRLGIMVALCELLRDKRRTKSVPVSTARGPDIAPPGVPVKV
jgi:hypothetical protein